MLKGMQKAIKNAQEGGEDIAERDNDSNSESDSVSSYVRESIQVADSPSFLFCYNPAVEAKPSVPEVTHYFYEEEGQSSCCLKLLACVCCPCILLLSACGFCVDQEDSDHSERASEMTTTITRYEGTYELNRIIPQYVKTNYHLIPHC